MAMRRVREILRYRFEDGLGHKAISYRVGAAPSTVRETLRRAEAAGLSWPLGEEITDAVLEAALYRSNGTKTGHRRSIEPDWAHVHRELKRKHVTLQILWDEHIALHPDGYRYSRFCDLYRSWAVKLPVTMRQTHGAGEKLFVDYAGDTVTVVVDRLKDKTRQAHLFVAVLGASSLSYAEARWTETLPDWLGCHVNALEAFGGAPALFVPDNAKVAVIKACRYDPQVNRSYAGMADHYGSSVLPTRPRRPRDVRAVRIIFTDPALTWVLIGVLDRTEFGDRRILSPNRIRGHRGAFFAFFSAARLLDDNQALRWSALAPRRAKG
jgi:transposase